MNTENLRELSRRIYDRICSVDRVPDYREIDVISGMILNWLHSQNNDEVNEAWDLVIRTCHKAWPDTEVCYWDNSPAELITKIIDERDALRQMIERPQPRPS